MIASAGWQIDDRNSRHVRLARLCAGPGAPRHRLLASIEEALRLATLPGEDEGRVYYIRYLRIAGLPEAGDRRIWPQRFQRALTEMVSQAVHGASPRAGSAQAVQFRSQDEALEILLHRILEGRPVREWFWPMVVRRTDSARQGATAGTESYSSRALPMVVEALRSTPAAWVAVATALFSSPSVDVVRLLEAIPEGAARPWLEEMDGRQPVPTYSDFGNLIPILKSMPAKCAILEAVRFFGHEDARTVWLTSLAILQEFPAEMTSGSVVKRSRMALLQLACEGLPGSVGAASQSGSPKSVQESETRARVSTDDSESAHQQGTGDTDSISREDAAQGAPQAAFGQLNPRPPASVSEPLADSTSLSSTLAATPASRRPDRGSGEAAIPPPRASLDGDSVTPAVIDELSPVPRLSKVDGVCTQAAGIFFLLNALARIGIGPAVACGLAAAWPDFVAHVFVRLAAHAGVASDDPISTWLNSLISSKPGDSPLPGEIRWWPSNLTPSRGSVSCEYLVRVWALGVRRYCWRTGRISVREIVARSGVFSVNRVDLDVSLPLEDAEIRIRRVGLDLDPGWLPWFGRVVRFHYPFGKELHG